MSDIDKDRAAFEAAYGATNEEQGLHFIPELNIYGSEFYVNHEAAERKSSAWYYWQARASLQVGVPGGWVNGLPPAGELCEARIPHHTADGMQMLWCEVEVIAHATIQGVVYSWVKEPGDDGGFYAPLMLSFRRVAEAPAAPTVKAEQVDMAGAYVGAREDLTIWKRRALEAEQKARRQEQIIDHLTLEAQGETRFGEPSLPAAGSAVEEVEVVGWRDPAYNWATISAGNKAGCLAGESWQAASVQKFTEPLMTVSQHNRIVAALSAQQIAPELHKSVHDLKNFRGEK